MIIIMAIIFIAIISLLIKLHIPDEVCDLSSLQTGERKFIKAEDISKNYAEGDKEMDEERKKRRDAYHKGLEEKKRYPSHIDRGPNLISENMMQKMGMGKSHYYLKPVKEEDLKKT